MKALFMILFSVILVDNLVLSKFLGICSYLGLSKNLKNAMGMSVAVTFVMLIATLCTWPIHYYLLLPLGLGYLDNLVFILVIASVVQVIEAIYSQKYSAALQGDGHLPAPDHHELRHSRHYVRQH